MAAPVRKRREASEAGADGVVIMVNADVETLSGTDHPVCAFIRRASQHFLDGAATPPLRGGEHPVLQFIHSFIAPLQWPDPSFSAPVNLLLIPSHRAHFGLSGSKAGSRSGTIVPESGTIVPELMSSTPASH